MKHSEDSFQIEQWFLWAADKSLISSAINPLAVMVFDRKLKHVIWSNPSAAKMFGGTDLAGFAAMQLPEKHPFIQQLKDAADDIRKKPIYRGIRIPERKKIKLLQCKIRKIKLSDVDGETTVPAILVECENKKWARSSEEKMIDRLMSSLNYDGAWFGLMDKNGALISDNGQDLPVEIRNNLAEIVTENRPQLKTQSSNRISIRSAGQNFWLYKIANAPARYVLMQDDPEKQDRAEADSTLIVNPVQSADNEDHGSRAGEKTVEDTLHSDAEEASSRSETETNAPNSGTQDTAKNEPKNGLISGVVAGVAAASTTLFGLKSNTKSTDNPKSEDHDETLKKNGTKESEPGTKVDATQSSDLTTVDQGHDGSDTMADDTIADDTVTDNAVADMVEIPLPDDGPSDSDEPVIEPSEAQVLEAGGSDNDEETSPRISGEAQLRDEFSFDPKAEIIKFSWNTDKDHIFISVSPELAQNLGPNAADIEGRSWQTVADVFGFDSSKQIANLLEKGGSWSNKSVLWPVQGTDLKVPIDLSAMPDRSAAGAFSGFKGVGTIRLLDAVVDPDAIGIALRSTTHEHRGQGAESVATQPAQPSPDTGELDNRTHKTDDHQSRHQHSHLVDSDQTNTDPETQPSNVVKLGVHRGATESRLTNGNSPSLSSLENRAFDEIGRRLQRSIKPGSMVGQASKPDETGLSDQRQAELHQPVDHQCEQSGRQEKTEGLASHSETFLLEKMPIPVAIFANYRAEYANAAFLNALDCSDLKQFQTQSPYSAIIRASLEDQSEAAIITNKGGQRWQVSSDIRQIPWQDGTGKLLTLISAPEPCTDMDEKVAIDMMQIAEMQNILDTATDGIILLDERGMIDSINPSAEALFGRPSKDVQEKSIKTLFAMESHKALDDAIANLGAQGIKSILNEGKEVIGIEAKGGMIPLYLTLGKVGKTGKLCAVLRDITEWKKTREELVEARREAEAANDKKSEFVARVSHEIRTPLNAIIGFSDVMLEERFGPIDSERYREYLRDINRSGILVLDLINDLLDLSKIEAGKMEMKFESVELASVISETIALLQPLANGSRVLLRTSLSGAVPNVVADARSIRQIVLNLVSNAIKFNQDNGQVIISTVYESSGEVVLRIRDTGHGMSREQVDKALKPFRQVSEISNPSVASSGLGLPLTKALVEANKAQFEVDSTPGEGTMVMIRFPTQRVLAD